MEERGGGGGGGGRFSAAIATKSAASAVRGTIIDISSDIDDTVTSAAIDLTGDVAADPAYKILSLPQAAGSIATKKQRTEGRLS
jgi:hypothetical protein